RIGHGSIVARRTRALAVGVLAAILSNPAAAAEFAVERREPLVVLVFSGKSQPLVSLTDALAIAARAIEPKTDFVRVSPEQAGFDRELAARCDRNWLSCWVRAVRREAGPDQRPPRFLLTLAVHPRTSDLASVQALLIDTDDAIATLRSARREEGSDDELE